MNNKGILYTYPNGLRLAFVKADDGKVKASLSINVLTGSENESTPQGLAHLLEHSLFKGTNKYSQEQLSVEFNKICANTNASTSTEFTKFTSKFPKFNIEKMCELFSSMLFDSVFDSVGLEKEKNVIIEEIKMCADDPSRFAFDKLIESMYSNTPMGCDIAGDPELLKKVTRDELIEFRNTHYIPENTIVAVIGDFDFDYIKGLVQKYFVDRFVEINTQDKIIKSYLPNITRKANVVVNKKDLFQSNVMMGMYIMDATSDLDQKKFAITNFVLGGSMSSRLFTKLRNEMSLCYSIYTDTYTYKNNGFMLVDFSTTKKNRELAIEAVKNEITNILQNGITEEEFETAKSVLLNTYLMKQDDPYLNISYLSYNGTLKDPEENIEEIKSITKEECEEVFRRYVNLDNMHISIVE